MTREEAIDLLDNLIGMVEDNHNSDYDTALQMGIQALEQEPILEKIKAEIEELEYDDFDCNLVLPAWKVYDIIDNYIAELKGENK